MTVTKVMSESCMALQTTTTTTTEDHNHSLGLAGQGFELAIHQPKFSNSIFFKLYVLQFLSADLV